MLKRFAGVLGSIALIASADAASARSWSHSPAGLASDYLAIQDNRGNGELAFVMWLAPPIVDGANANAEVKALLRQNVIIGFGFYRVDQNTGEFTVRPSGDVEVTTGAGVPLKEITEAKRNPVLAGATVTMGSMMAKGMGKLGAGMVWRTYAAGSVDACKPGGLRVRLAGVDYTYDTPVPGC